MSHDEYWTLEDYLEQQRSLRSPTLQRSAPNFDTLDTPPPLVDAPDGYNPPLTETTSTDNNSAERQEYNGRPQPSQYDTLLVKSLGPDYPSEIADRAGIELFLDDPERPCEDRVPDVVDEPDFMIDLTLLYNGPMTGGEGQTTQQVLNAPRRASAKLNSALSPRPNDHILLTQRYGAGGMAVAHNEYVVHDRRDKRQVSISISTLTHEDSSDSLKVSGLSIQSLSPDGPFEVQSPSRPVLPALQINHPPYGQIPLHQESISSSPALAKFAITPLDRQLSTLPRLQNHVSSPSTSSLSPEPSQTLPSLESALSAVTDLDRTPYLDNSPGLYRPSPVQLSQPGLSPAIYSNGTSNTTLSPPRFSTDPASWRSLSRGNSDSTSSDAISGHSSAHSSTPAIIHSPPHSASTPQYPPSEHESISDSDFSTQRSSSDPNVQLGLAAQQGYSCSFPGCNAPPFQTQYLLNSHQNVHSNQRPHFCPVDSCPRGPGGQGFKRKNEMIR